MVIVRDDLLSDEGKALWLAVINLALVEGDHRWFSMSSRGFDAEWTLTRLRPRGLIGTRLAQREGYRSRRERRRRSHPSKR